MDATDWLVLTLLVGVLVPANVLAYRIARRRKLRNYTGPAMAPIVPGYLLGRLVARAKGKVHR